MIPTEILNYRLIRPLGSGGMGQVFLAQNKNINQLVAIKSLHPQYANNMALRNRFKQEAVMLSSLNHPNIVKFLNYVENEYGVFLIMEYVDGYTLEDFINKKNGLIVEKRAYPMMSEILDAFSYAHKRGIVHRDIKPSNIFINSEGHIKVMDFGIAQILSDVGAGGAGPVMGTPEYMSPEQVFGHTIDQRSDIYSLGVLLHQMLTGRAPYDATTLSELEIKRRVINDSLPRMKDYYPYVSEGLQKVVDKATSKNVCQRYSSCDEMKKAIKQVVDPDPVNKTALYGGIAIAVVIIGVALGVWDYYRTKVSYYKDYVEFYGVPKGIGKLSSREMGHRSASYRIESSRHKVRRMTLVNAQGKAINHSDTEYMNSRYSDVEYFYTDNGNIDYKKVYNPYGKLLFKLDYDENLKTATFKYDDEYGTAMRLQSNTTELYVDRSDGSIERSRISRYLLHFNEETGVLEQLLYAGGENNDRVGDKDNIYGQAYEYDDEGRIITVKFLGQDGKVRGNKIGLGIKKYTYDDDDNWATVAYYSPDGKPSHDGNNCALVTLSYDKWGNRISEVYTSMDGKPSLRTDNAVFGFKYEYDDDGNRIKQTCINGKGEPMTNKFGWVTEAIKYDENGFCTELRFLDLNNEPANNSQDGEAVSIIKSKPNDVGLDLETSYYNTAGELMEQTTGVARVVWEYDSVGNIIRVSDYDKKGNPALCNGFFSSVTLEYDDFYRETKKRFLDAKGQLTDCGDGTCGYNVVYDAQGNIYQYINIGKDGKTPVRCNDGYAYIVYKYDDVGNNTVREFCDEKGGNCLTSSGFHKMEMTYEPKTNFLVEVKYSGLNGLLYSEHYKYDSNGNVLKEYTVTASGQLKGSSVVENYEYDQNNRVKKTWYTNLSGTLVNCPGTKYSQILNTYDERGNVTVQTFLNSSGGAGADNMGTHKRIHEFDAANNVIYEKSIDANGNPISGKNASPEGRVTYDERGNRTSVTCFNGYGKAYTCADGYHKRTWTYDERNHVLTDVMTDVNGRLAKSRSDGYAKLVNTYDGKGNNTSAKYYDDKGKLDYEMRSTFNSHNMQTKLFVCDASGKQNDKTFGFARIDVSYQSNGIIPTQRKYYNASGKLIATQAYNSKTNQWGTTNLVGGSRNVITTTNWKNTWIESQRSCPAQLTQGVYITRITLIEDNISLYMKLTKLTQSDVEANIDQIKSAVRQMRTFLRKNTGTPSYVGIDIYVYDKSSNFVFMI